MLTTGVSRFLEKDGNKIEVTQKHFSARSTISNHKKYRISKLISLKIEGL